MSISREEPMIFADHQIDSAIMGGIAGHNKPLIHPYDARQVQPSSYDVRLAKEFRVFRSHEFEVIDPREDMTGLTELVIHEEGTPFVLHPGEFVLGSTVEVISLPAWLAARIEGKSSLGRLGLMIHSTAGYIDPGFSGTVTLELSNVTRLPIRLWPGMLIGQVNFVVMNSTCHRPYGTHGLGSKYQDQRTPAESRMHLNGDRAINPDHPSTG